MVYTYSMHSSKTTEIDWKKKLTPEQYRVMREKGTEPPFSSKVLKNHEKGVYTCAACGHELFSSDAKYEAQDSFWNPNAGWPSFSSAVNNDNIELRPDDSFGMHRTEILCKHCGSHLGHLFDDGPTETKEHYCINGCTLEFKKT